MISNVKRVITIGKKPCLICQKEFQPASGAQLTCSPECKAKARAQGLTKRGPRNRGAVDPALEEPPYPISRAPGERVFFNGQPVDPVDNLPVLEVPARVSSAVPASPPSRTNPLKPVKTTGSSVEALPELEIDLAPVENYLKFLVQKEVHQVLKAGLEEAIQEALSDRIKEVVKEEIAERLKGLIER